MSVVDRFLRATLGEPFKPRETDDHTVAAAPGRRHWLPNLRFVRLASPVTVTFTDGSQKKLEVAVFALDERSYRWLHAAPPPCAVWGEIR